MSKFQAHSFGQKLYHKRLKLVVDVCVFTLLTFSPCISSGHARDFGVEPSSVLLLRVLKKDPVGLERDPATTGAACLGRAVWAEVAVKFTSFEMFGVGFEDGSRWFKMVQDGSRWFKMVQDGSSSKNGDRHGCKWWSDCATGGWNNFLLVQQGKRLMFTDFFSDFG